MSFGGILAVIIIVAALVGGYLFYKGNFQNKTVPINTQNQSLETVPN